MALFPLVLLLLVCSGATSDLNDVLTITKIEVRVLILTELLFRHKLLMYNI